MWQQLAARWAAPQRSAHGKDHPVRLYYEILSSCDWSAWESQYVLLIGQPPIRPRILASAILKSLFRQLRRIALDMAFACLDTVGVNRTPIRANSSRGRTVGSETIAKQMAKLDQQIDRMFSEAKQADAREGPLFADDSPNNLPKALSTLSKRQAKLAKAMVAVLSTP